MGAFECPEWNAYVSEVRDTAATREVEIIGRYTELTSKGNGEHLGLSPLRTEKTASFYVYEGRGFYDFGSSQGGDLIEFVRRRDPTLTFRQAIDFLARELGLDDWDTRKQNRGGPADPDALSDHIKEMGDTERIFAAATWLVHLCHELLPTSVREHMRRRYGYSDAFIDKQKIGWCPDALWDIAHAADIRPFSDDELLSTGWFFPGRGGAIAALGSRIVFPYWKNGQARYAIGREHFGRASRSDIRPEWYVENAWDQGKYKKLPVRKPDKHDWISPHVRNDVLWGEDTLRSLRADGVLYITEGVADAGILWMLSFPVISPVTVNFRNDDVVRVLALLKHYRVKKIVILNDNDTTPDGKHPGLDGAKRMASGLWKAGFPTFIARLPRPEGAQKTDINEIAVAALQAVAPEAAEENARAVVQRIADGAESYPEFLVSEEDPKKPFPDLEPLLAELGALTERRSALENLALIDKVFARFPALPKKPARKIFQVAAAKATNARLAEEAANPPPPAQEGAAPATGGGAPAPKKKKAPTMRGHVLARADGYYERESKIGDLERISNFRLVPLKRIAHEKGGPDWMCVRVEGIDTSWDATEGCPTTFAREWSIKPSAWVTKRAFIAAFPSAFMAWTGSDEDVQGVLELLTEDKDKLPVVRATGVIGRHTMADGSSRFALPSGTLGPDGQWMANADLVYLPDGGSNLQHRLPTEPADLASPETRALAKEFFEDMLRLHEGAPVATIASWLMASTFAPYLRSKTGVFPILNVFATAGSGKTSLFHGIFWPAFTGVQRGELLSCTSSAFAYARDFSSANALALFLDEFKRSDMGPKALEQLYRNIRRLYSGDTETRGRADQDVNTYYLIIPVGILGEDRLEGDQAINERCIFVPLDANWLDAHPEAKALYYKLAGKKLWTIAPLVQSWSMIADAPAMFARAESLLATILSNLKRTKIPERVRANLLTIVFGAVALDACARWLGTEVADVSLQETIDWAIAQIFEEEGGKSTRVRDNLDELYIEGGIMATLGTIAEGKHYVWVDGKLRLWVTGILAASAEWRRGQGVAATLPGGRAINKLARERLAGGDTYVTGVNKDTPLDDDRRAECLEIDLTKVPASLGGVSYPAYKEKTWGGKRKSGEMDWTATAKASRIKDDEKD